MFGLVSLVSLFMACGRPNSTENRTGTKHEAPLRPSVAYLRTEVHGGSPIDVIELRVPDGPPYVVMGFGPESLIARRQNLVEGEWVDRPAIWDCLVGIQERTVPPGSRVEIHHHRRGLVEDPPEVRSTRVGVRIKREFTDDWFNAWSAPFLLECPSPQETSPPSGR